MKRLVLELDDDLHHKLKMKAIAQNKSMRQIWMELIIKWLNKS